MRRVLHLTAAVALVFVSLQASVRAADEMVTNPPFKHWSAFKVGATVTQKEKVRFAKDLDEADYYPNAVHEKDVTYTLLEVTPQKVVVQSTVTDYGVGSMIELASTKIIYPAEVVKEHVATSKSDIESFKEGDEDVKLLGKTIKCHWVDLMDKEGDESIQHKMWSSDEVPGGIVKDVKITKKGDKIVSESEIEVVSYETK